MTKRPAAQQFTRERRKLLSDVRRIRTTFDAENTIELTNGIKLHLKPINQSAVRRARTSLERPKAPIWTDPERPERSEENPDDPDYQNAMTAYYADLLNLTFKMMCVLGTEFVSAPDGAFAPDDDRWVELLQGAGVPVAFVTTAERYWEWMELYALDTPIDRATVAAALIPRLGIMDAEVMQAIATFRSDTQRDGLVGVPLEAVAPRGAGDLESMAGDDLGGRGTGRGAA